MGRRLAILACALSTMLGVAGAIAGSAAAATNPRAQVALLSGQTLGSGTSVTSPDGRFALTMMSDGNLVLALANPHGAPRTLWSTGTGSAAGASAALESNGNLVIDEASGATLWSNNVASSGCANLDVQDDGNLVLYNASGAYWASNTLQHTLEPGDELLPGQTILAPGADYELQMGPDGRLRLIDSAGTVWTSPGGGPAGSYAEMNPNGNLEIISTGGAIDWSTDTDAAGDENAAVELTTTGDAEVVATSGSALWSSDTSATRSGLVSLNIARSYTSCPTAPPPPPAPVPGPTPIHPHAPTSGTVTFTLPGVRVSISVRWRFDGAESWMSDATVRHFPRGARLTISCTGSHGCPTRTIHRHGHRITRRERFSASARHVRAMMRQVVGRRFRVGARVIFSVTERGHRPARSEAIIRRGESPRSRVLH
jgi:hypothetical protein